MRTKSTFVLIAAAAALAGCLGDVRIIQTYNGESYYDGAFEFATQEGKIDTVVLGTPFRAAGPDIPTLTTDHMKGATAGRVVTFVPTDWKKPDDAFRVVVMFNGKQPHSPHKLCELGADIGLAETPSDVQMEAAFCHGKYLLSWAEGFSKPLTGPEDPRFRELVRGVAYEMIPPYDINKAGSGEASPPQ